MEKYSTVKKISNVDSPFHYNQGKIECIEAIESMTEKMSGCFAPHASNVVKYVWRFEHKNGIEDIDKALWYLNRLRDLWIKNNKCHQ